MEENNCTLCGCPCCTISFKDGYVCEDCIGYIKSSSWEFTNK